MRHQTKLLSGTRILVTRPSAQAISLCHAIRTAGGVPLLFPVFEIVPALSLVTPDELVALQHADIVIFSSANAVSFCPKAYLEELRLSTSASRALFAMGPSTQKALEQKGLTLTVEPNPPFNSEALLELSFLKTVRQKKILLVTGEGGRTHLEEAFQKRGAEVSYLKVYTRRKTEENLPSFWKEQNPEIILTTSNEILQAVYDKMKGAELFLLKTPLIVTGKRAMLLAEELGFKMILAMSFYDEKRLIEAIAEYDKRGIRTWVTMKKQQNKRTPYLRHLKNQPLRYVK